MISGTVYTSSASSLGFRKEFVQSQSRHAPSRAVSAKAESDYKVSAADISKITGAGREWLQTLLARFNPVSERSSNPAVLDFEKPLIELDKRITEVREVAEANDVDVSDQIKQLEDRAEQLRRDTFERLTPHQRLQVARHPNRPTCLDIILNITDKFVELHGDRSGLDDPAIVCGVGSINDQTIMFIGHQKGRNTKENVERNFGMPQPNGYRKALRFMKHADKFGFPIVTFIDTPGAYPGQSAEEKGQGEAIAKNLMDMFGLRVPMLTIVIGEGGSGGALAIGCGNKMAMMDYAVYYVASPEACAAILWKRPEAAPEAASSLKITSTDLVRLGIVDDVIPEPMGGAHQDPKAVFPVMRDYISGFLDEYGSMSASEVKKDRYNKYRRVGVFNDFFVGAGQWEEARKLRSEATGVEVATGGWAVDAEEAEYLQKQAEQEAAFQQILDERSDWLKPPTTTPFSMVDSDGPNSKVQPEKKLAGNSGNVPEVGNVATQAAELVEQVRVQNGAF